MRTSLILALMLMLGGCSDSAQQLPTPVIADLRGQWVVVNYWAKWCKPCIAEIPELNRLNREFAAVTVLGVNYDGESGEELSTQIRDLGVDFAMLAQDPAPELGTPRPMVLPTTLILDPAGQLTQTLIGPQTLESLAEATGQTVGH
jgi:thiol-disulfide isomerase/thioredoxin